MAFTLPIINGSSGVWGDILNRTLTEMNETLQGIVDGGGTGGGGGFTVCTNATLPDPPVVGQITLETDTGWLSYVASIAGTATRVPFPGSWVARYRCTVAHPMASGALFKIPWTVADFDRYTTFSGTNPTRFTAPVAGTYEFTGGASWENNNTGYRRLSVFANGVETASAGVVGNATTTTASIANMRSLILRLTAGQYVEVAATHTATGDLNIDVGSAHAQPVLNVKYLGYNV